jgi:hypothetical protein
MPTLPLTATTAADAYQQLRTIGIQTKRVVTQLVAQINSGTVYPEFLIDVISMADATITLVMGIRGTPGLLAYVQVVWGDATIEFGNLLTAALMALIDLKTTIVSEYPHDPETGILHDRVFDENGNIAWQRLPADQFQQSLAKAQAFLDTID